MQSERIALKSIEVGGRTLDLSYGHLFVVIRDGRSAPGPTDWEINLQTSRSVPVKTARHNLSIGLADGSSVSGAAFVRFSDGRRHLLRGDAPLVGFTRSARPPEG